MKKAYIATAEIEIVVLAESEQSARELAVEAIVDELSSAPLAWDDISIKKMTYIPAGWELDTPVYHDGDGDISVEDALKMKE